MKKIFYLLLFCFTIECNLSNESKKESKITKSWVDVELEYAKWFKLEKNINYDHTFRVSVYNPFMNDTVTYITGENTRSVVMMANNIGYLSSLNLQDDVIGVSSLNYVFDSVLQSKSEAQMLPEVGDMVALNKEMIFKLSPDYIISSGFQSTYSDLIWLPSKTKALITYEWMESNPLATLEWVKVYGALFGKYKEANKFFKNITKKYNQIKKTRQKTKGSKILSGSIYSDIWYTPGGLSYKGQIYKDAGVDYFYSKDSTRGSISLSIEEVIDKQLDCDFWLLSIEVNSIKKLKKIHRVYKEFDCVKNKRVYTSNLLTNTHGVNGFWELYQVRPDLYLSDIISISDSNYNSNLNFFKKID